jgi:hypothetical protein
MVKNDATSENWKKCHLYHAGSFELKYMISLMLKISLGMLTNGATSENWKKIITGIMWGVLNWNIWSMCEN